MVGICWLPCSRCRGGSWCCRNNKASLQEPAVRGTLLTAPENTRIRTPLFCRSFSLANYSDTMLAVRRGCSRASRGRRWRDEFCSVASRAKARKRRRAHLLYARQREAKSRVRFSSTHRWCRDAANPMPCRRGSRAAIKPVFPAVCRKRLLCCVERSTRRMPAQASMPARTEAGAARNRRKCYAAVVARRSRRDKSNAPVLHKCRSLLQ